ncbi:MAG: DUF3842 family protein [Synergistaceae bacterium]|nr:DUF3842 family protein [Synergistaceae bacterium]
MFPLKIVVVDGQGGALGKSLISAVRRLGCCAPDSEILAIGTNSVATVAMLGAGADYGATGENPVVVACADADIISGPIGIVVANSMFGEITPNMACKIGGCRAKKILIPVNKCEISIAGAADLPYSDYVKIAAGMIAGEVKKLRGEAKPPHSSDVFKKDADYASSILNK